MQTIQIHGTSIKIEAEMAKVLGSEGNTVSLVNPLDYREMSQSLQGQETVAYFVEGIQTQNAFFQGKKEDFFLLAIDNVSRLLIKFNILKLILPVTLEPYFRAFLGEKICLKAPATSLMLDKENQVFSIQRYVKFPTVKIEELVDIYFQFLNYLFLFLIRTFKEQKGYSISLFKKNWKLLELQYRDVGEKDLICFTITGGILSSDQQEGIFEFRFLSQQIENRNCLMTTLCGFAPRLPWPLYRLIQAPLHGLVMAIFGFYLKWKDRK